MQWKEEKDELTSTIEGLKEDAQTLNEQFVKQQEEMLQQANEYKVNMIISKYLDESKMLDAFGYFFPVMNRKKEFKLVLQC